MTDWRPSASLEILAARAALLADLRAFFAKRGVMEVETPLLAQSTVTDPGIEPFKVCDGAEPAPRFLQTSPEYAMKRLLAAGAPDIYQMGKAFRSGESGRHHNPEFTMLEWYRLGWDHSALIREVAELVCGTLGVEGWQVWPYRRLFESQLNFDPLDSGISLSQLTDIAAAHVGPVPDQLGRDGLLDLLMSHCIEPAIRDWGVVFITDFPVSQAALARHITVAGEAVAARFECYAGGHELANGYWEQVDVALLMAQFAADRESRAARGLPARDEDPRLLAAQDAGLPSCAGVALGVDRLLALQQGVESLAEVISFDWSRA